MTINNKDKKFNFLFRNKTLTSNSNKNIGSFESFPWIKDIINFGNQGWSLCSCFRYFYLTSPEPRNNRFFNFSKNRLRKPHKPSRLFLSKNIHYTKTIITPISL